VKDVQNIATSDDLLRLWLDAPKNMVLRIKGFADAEQFVHKFGSAFLWLPLGNRLK